MSNGLRQAALTLVSIGAIGLIGASTPPAREASSAATPVVADPPTVPPPSRPYPSTPATLAFATTTTTGPASPRSLTVQVYPQAAAADLTVTDDSGSSTAAAAFDGTLTGDVTLEVSSAGYRPERHVIASERAGTYEVFLDPSGQVVDRTMAFLTGAGPKQVAFTPDRSELWVTLLGGSGLEVYDPGTGQRLTEIDLPGAGSVEVLFDAAGATAWVSQMETARVYEIDVADRGIRRHLATEGSWTKVMALSPDETRLWASNWVSNDVSEFDLGTGRLVRRLPAVATPRGLVTDATGSRLYVAGYEAGEIQVIDLETGEGKVIHRTGGAMRHLVRDPASGRIFASDMARDLIFVVDPATDTVEEFASTDRLPNTIDISPDGRLLAVSNRGRNHPETYYLPGPEWGSVLLFDTTTGEILDAVVGGNQSTGLDVSADGRWLAYSDFLDNRVSVLALPSIERLEGGNGGRAAIYRQELQK